MQTQQLPKPGQRVECVFMDDEYDPIAPGSKGTVLKLDTWGLAPHEHSSVVNIHVAWDSGRTLALLSDVDKWKVLSAEGNSN